ncbi:hypothetical protein [Mucilaginibacter sp. AK015]|uniref:hypothetical protein n=1 Tax=Mucilaginibacter sp. AK015 TaxID=2723072 RepID=UPI001608B2A2|nr:hypothetical protein [Mucilaginibacter sp. AK015]MBB5396105.1 hypothetical protein [Mucilaginibacter sp. AK015]
MSSIRSFAAPHKGLRYIISKFAIRLGHTDFGSPAQLGALKQLGLEMFTLLDDHVHTENEHTLKQLEERVPGASGHDVADHEKLETVQHSLAKKLSGFSGQEISEEIHQFYLDFSLFQSQYLEHIYEEETVTEMLLQQNFSDEELTGHRNQIMDRLAFPVLLLWLKYIIPAQREEESLGMLSGFKANAPQDAFGQVLAALKTELEDERYDSLMSKLA